MRCSKQLRKAARTLKRFPDTPDEHLLDRFPLVSIGEVKRYERSLSHTANKHIDY